MKMVSIHVAFVNSKDQALALFDPRQQSVVCLLRLFVAFDLGGLAENTPVPRRPAIETCMARCTPRASKQATATAASLLNQTISTCGLCTTSGR
uniref:Uncharacterized protein n=1 Tax=Peronospora matthiolae TaxID=2874970 RepID=A0AAV1V2E6_9STRA